MLVRSRGCPKNKFYNHFKPIFRHLHKYLSQNWSWDGHFEVLNGSIYIQKLWHKTQLFPFSFLCDFVKKNIRVMFLAIFMFFVFFFIFVLTFEPIKILNHSAPRNDFLNFSFVKDIYVDGENLAWNGCKTAICQSTYFGDTLFNYMNQNTVCCLGNLNFPAL